MNPEDLQKVIEILKETTAPTFEKMLYYVWLKNLIGLIFFSFTSLGLVSGVVYSIKSYFLKYDQWGDRDRDEVYLIIAILAALLLILFAGLTVDALTNMLVPEARIIQILLGK